MSLDECVLEVVSGISPIGIKQESMLSNFRAVLQKNIQAYSHKSVPISAESVFRKQLINIDIIYNYMIFEVI